MLAAFDLRLDFRHGCRRVDAYQYGDNGPEALLLAIAVHLPVLQELSLSGTTLPPMLAGSCR